MNGRSMDYNLSALELDMSNEKDKSTGTLLSACQFKINKKTNELEIENYQTPGNFKTLWTGARISASHRPNYLLAAA